MSSPPLSAIVLAAGEGTRMRSQRPKPLHLLCGRPMLFYVLDALADVQVGRTVVVVGHGAERVTKRVQEEGWPNLAIDFVEQTVQHGTGDAASVGLTAFNDEDPDDHDTVLVLPGDAPLLQASTIAALVSQHAASGARQPRFSSRAPHGPHGIRAARTRARSARGAHRRAARRHARGARDQRGVHLDLLLPPQPARPRTAPALARERAG